METQLRIRRRRFAVTGAADEPDHPRSRSTPSTPRRARFAALRSRNYRLFLLGQSVATTGLWVQRVAQSWLVLDLTGNAAAVGVTTGLQFAPMVVFGFAGGWIADRFPKRRVLQATQIVAALMAGLLAGLTLSHHVTAWQVQLMAAGLGTVAAIDQPVRQAFVTELVGQGQVYSAVSLNASIFQLGALIGPAVSGTLISVVGPGWAFALNAVSYAAPLAAYARIDPGRLHHQVARAGELATGGLRELARRPQFWWPLMLAGAVGMFSVNLPVTLATYARAVHSGPGGYALLTTTVAVGSVLGALIAAGRTRTTLRGLSATGCAVAGLYLIAATMPTPWSLGCVLAAIGMATELTFTSANATLQLSTGATLRGRVMGTYLVVTFGAGALGGPLLGTIDQHLGPRAGLALAGAIPAAVLLLAALTHLILRHTIRRPATRTRRAMSDPSTGSTAVSRCP
jgi:MFS family permease